MQQFTFILLALVHCSNAVEPSKELDDVMNNLDALENILHIKRSENAAGGLDIHANLHLLQRPDINEESECTWDGKLEKIPFDCRKACKEDEWVDPEHKQYPLGTKYGVVNYETDKIDVKTASGICCKCNKIEKDRTKGQTCGLAWYNGIYHNGICKSGLQCVQTNLLISDGEKHCLEYRNETELCGRSEGQQKVEGHWHDYYGDNYGECAEGLECIKADPPADWKGIRVSQCQKVGYSCPTCPDPKCEAGEKRISGRKVLVEGSRICFCRKYYCLKPRGLCSMIRLGRRGSQCESSESDENARKSYRRMPMHRGRWRNRIRNLDNCPSGQVKDPSYDPYEQQGISLKDRFAVFKGPCCKCIPKAQPTAAPTVSINEEAIGATKTDPELH